MSLKASLGLSLVAIVREEFDETARGREAHSWFVDLALVGGGTSVVLKSWEVEEWKAGDYAADQRELTEFIAGKIGEWNGLVA